MIKRSSFSKNKFLERIKAFNKLQKILFCILVVYLTLFVFFYFVYFLPPKIEHWRISKLPSHDLTLFVDVKGNFIGVSHSMLNRAESYDGTELYTAGDIIQLFNNDTFVARKINYFYDDQNGLFMTLYKGSNYTGIEGSGLFSINEYMPYSLYFENAYAPFLRCIKLGPLFSIGSELSPSQIGSTSSISGSRYGFMHNANTDLEKVSILSTALQIAFAYLVYIIPLIICFFWRNYFFGILVFFAYLYVSYLSFIHMFTYYVTWSL